MIDINICAILVIAAVILGFGAGVYVSLPKKKKEHKPPTVMRIPKPPQEY